MVRRPWIVPLRHAVHDFGATDWSYGVLEIGDKAAFFLGLLHCSSTPKRPELSVVLNTICGCSFVVYSFISFFIGKLFDFLKDGHKKREFSNLLNFLAFFLLLLDNSTSIDINYLYTILLI